MPQIATVPAGIKLSSFTSFGVIAEIVAPVSHNAFTVEFFGLSIAALKTFTGVIIRFWIFGNQ